MPVLAGRSCADKFLQNPFKRRRLSFAVDQDQEMSIVAQPSDFLNVPSSTGRFLRPQHLVDDDLESSFASNVSLNSPPRDSLMVISQDYDGVEPMDISPCPPPRPAATQNKFSRPRAFTSSARLFGRDVSNDDVHSPHEPPFAPPKPAGATVSNKRIQRSALPTEWTIPINTGSTKPLPKTNETKFPAPPVSPISEDAMDVDSPFKPRQLEPAIVITSSFDTLNGPQSAAPTVNTFSNLFYDTNSPRRAFDSPALGLGHKKPRRSLSPDSVRKNMDLDPSLDLSSDLPSSPSERRIHRVPSGPLLSRVTGGGVSKPSLQGLGIPSRSRRSGLVTQPDQPRSAAPSMHDDEKMLLLPRALPTRRAFSAMLPPTVTMPSSPDPDASSSFDMPDYSSPAQAYAIRQQIKTKTLRRCDGTDNFKATSTIGGMDISDSPSTSRFLKAGIPGFGDNESHGKLLPCHRVSEDGLMRIVPETLDMLLDGKYDTQITNYLIIDCRFDYEYEGGHIPGAVNVRTTERLEELLLGSSMNKPTPSVSGDKAKKTILVFHCEFSAKRAPTFAKYLRSKDRAANNHVYPKIYYPEVYVLEGGYCRYFKTSGARCQPPAYVPMDDPQHKVSAKSKMDLFERKTKFGRHKSYAYGDQPGPRELSVRASMLQQQKIAEAQQQVQAQHKRNTAPNVTNGSLFAAANAARSRRGTMSTHTLASFGDDDDDDEDTDIGDSPCPPPNKGGLKPVALKSNMGKGMIRTLRRSETYDPARVY